MKILEAFGEPISYGGQENFIINALDHMDREGMQFDFLTPYYCDNETIAERVRDYGGSVRALKCSFNPGGFRWNTVYAINDYLKKNRYDVIHIHSGSNSMLAIYAFLARKRGIRQIIVHSHSTGINGLKHIAARSLSMISLLRYPTDYCACSKDAGRWRFPSSVCKQRLRVINNGIDPMRFKFSEEKRQMVRHRLGIGNDEKLVACMGRLCKSKNQAFVIKLLFGSNEKYRDEFKLLLVGAGEDEGYLRDLARSLGAEGKVIFTGNVEEVSEYYFTADVLAVPSLYEGFGLVVLEGQAAGLEVIASDHVPKESNVSGRVSFVPLSDKRTWLEFLCSDHNRHPDQLQMIKESHYSADAAAEEIKSLYMRK